jgi:hypothetical protein
MPERRPSSFHKTKNMDNQTEPLNEHGDSIASDQIELSRLMKSDTALKQEVASLKDANLSLEKRIAALEVKPDEAGAEVELPQDFRSPMPNHAPQ